MTEKTIPIKIYINDRKRLHLLQARLEVMKEKKLTQADTFRCMMQISEKELDRCKVI